MNTIEIEEQYGLSVCNRQPLVIERGEGNQVWDQQGRCWLDFTSGWGVTSLGHSHPVVIEALARQAAKIMQNPNSGFTYSPARAALLLRLRQVLPPALERVYFANSGAEANDAAIKLARKTTGRRQVIAASRSFHGRTMSTLSVSGGPDNAVRFLSPHVDNLFVDFGDLPALQACLSECTAAVILEVVQGEGGVRIAPPGYLQAVSQLCQQHGALLIIDEVQTGFCRTGPFFAIDDEQLVPDILTMGKGIAAGLPFAAFAVSRQVAAAVQKGDHGGTYCGNPLACAVSEAVIGFLLENNVMQQVREAGEVALAGLQKLALQHPQLVREVRGKGLLLALDLGDDDRVSAVTQACLENGLLVTPTRNGVIRLLPGLLVSRQEIEAGLALLGQALAQIELPRACAPAA